MRCRILPILTGLAIALGVVSNRANATYIHATFGSGVSTNTVGAPTVAVPFSFTVWADGFPSGPTGDVVGWEFSLSISSEIIVLSRTLNPPSALNVGSGDNFIVGTGVPQIADPLVLVTYQALILGPLAMPLITIGPSVPSDFPGTAPGGYLDPLDGLHPFEFASALLLDPSSGPPPPLYPIPEPSTALLLAFGLVGLAAAHRLRVA
jgi:hypothetical protein